jgi:hypothetical protein
MGNVIAGQSDDIGLQTARSFDGSLNLLTAGKWAVMDIREMNYSKTIELRR